MIYDDGLKNVTFRVFTKFSFDLAWWPNFLPQVTQFQIQPKEHQDKQFQHDSWWLFQKSDLKSVNKVFLSFDPVT